MQDPSIYSQIKPQFLDQEHLKCPRCDSANTKFCYYNNYNLSQPRHFCKNCRRYWTKGGALRNIPVGGGSRKNTKRSSSTTKRSSSTSAGPPAPSSSQSSAAAASPAVAAPKAEPYVTSAPADFDQDRRMMMVDVGGGNFGSLLWPNAGQYGNFYEGLNPDGSSLQLYGFGEHDLNKGRPGSVAGCDHHGDPGMSLHNGNGNRNNSEGFLSGESNGDSGCWNGANGWPDLAIYTPGSNFQ